MRRWQNMALEDGKKRRPRVFRGILLALALVMTGLAVKIVLFVAGNPPAGGDRVFWPQEKQK